MLNMQSLSLESTITPQRRGVAASTYINYKLKTIVLVIFRLYYEIIKKTKVKKCNSHRDTNVIPDDLFLYSAMNVPHKCAAPSNSSELSSRFHGYDNITYGECSIYLWNNGSLVGEEECVFGFQYEDDVMASAVSEVGTTLSEFPPETFIHVV